MQINLIYCSRVAETKVRLQELVRDNFPQHTLRCINAVNTDVPQNLDINTTIFYGAGDDYDLSKKSFLEFIADIIPNTLTTRDALGEFDSVVIKENNRTIICLNKDGGSNQRYKFYPRKTEWRVNYSYGKVNNVLNKNLLVGELFGKVGDNSRWTKENNSLTRQYLTDITKQIGERVVQRYPKVKHFGIDFIRNNDDDKFYILELNRANSRNLENCQFLLENFLDNYQRTSFATVKNTLINRINNANNIDDLHCVITATLAVDVFRRQTQNV